MKAHQIRTGIGKGCREAVYRLHHQVHIDRHRRTVRRFGVRFESLTNHGPKCQVGNVMVVHHVKMYPVCPRSNYSPKLIAQTGKIG